jgi:hypothetical protein
MKRCARNDGGYRGKRLPRGPGDEQILSRIDNSLGNCGNLLGSFPLPEHHFRKTLADAPVVVDPGEAQILEGAVAQKLKEPGLCSLRRYGPGLDRLEEGAELRSVHRDKSLTGVDFGASWTVKLPIVPCDGIIFL